MNTINIIGEAEGLFDRTLTVTKGGSLVYLKVEDGRGRFVTTLLGAATGKLVDALLPEGSVVVTDLPKVHREDDGSFSANGHYRQSDCNIEDLMKRVKALLAIASEINALNDDKQVAAAAAAEAARDNRRDELAVQYCLCNRYYMLGSTSKKLVDRIIELEDAARPMQGEV